MTGLKFKVEDWIQGFDADPRRSETTAEFVLLIGDVPVTRLFDSWSRTVTDRARLPLFSMAEWFAANWWRLHAEAPYEGGQPPTSWRLSHDLPAIGGGLVWPRVRFASDDSAIQVSARALRNAPWEPVRHLNDAPPEPVKISEFDHAVDGLVDLVLERLSVLGISAEPLMSIWNNVKIERADPDLTEWRRWEARLGYDPDEAPEVLMAQIQGLFSRVGKKAAAEVAPMLGEGASETLGGMERLSVSPGVVATLPLCAKVRPDLEEAAPWELGRTLARQVRAEIDRPGGLLSDRDLLNLLGSKENAFEQLTPSDATLGLGVRVPRKGKRSVDQTVLHFRKRNSAGVRFEAARFVAESLIAPKEDTWLPLTDRATARQKVQRAFAIELLAPISEVAEQIGELRTPEVFEDLGDRYGVSALAIRSHLANHGLMMFDEVS